MNELFERARPYLANPDQLCRARLSRLEEGSGRGQRIIDADNGSGLAFTVTPDRAMNIVECSFRGIPVSFRTPCGHRGVTGDWLGDWTGGLLTTCGLRNAGSPSGTQKLHGAISAEAAEQLSIRCRNGEIEISGLLRESSMFGANLTLERTIRTACGSNAVDISDVVENHAESPEFTEIIYHCNFGWPLAAPGLVFDVPEHPVEPRNAEAAAGLAEWNVLPPPLDGFSEQCFLHTLPKDSSGMACMRIVNRELKVAVEVQYDTSTLPRLVQWKKPSRCGYVLGLEPTNASLRGCEFDRENGFGTVLPPGGSIAYHVRIRFS